MRKMMMFAAAAAGLASAAWAEGASAQDEEDKVICRRVEAGQTGTRLRRFQRICRTQSEWRGSESSSDQQQRQLEERQNGAATSPR